MMSLTPQSGKRKSSNNTPLSGKCVLCKCFVTLLGRKSSCIHRWAGNVLCANVTLLGRRCANTPLCGKCVCANVTATQEMCKSSCIHRYAGSVFVPMSLLRRRCANPVVYTAMREKIWVWNKWKCDCDCAIDKRFNPNSLNRWVAWFVCVIDKAQSDSLFGLWIWAKKSAS